MWRSVRTDPTSEPFNPAQRLALSRVECTEHGVSLIELMIVLTLLASFFGVVYESVIVGLRTVGTANTREDLRLQLARTLDRFTREVQMVRNVDVATDTQFQFDADLNGDGDATDSGEANISYQVVGTTLTRSQGSATITLIGNLSSASAVDVFNYYETSATTESDTCDNSAACGTATCTPLGCQCRCEIRVVVLTVTVTNGNETISMSSSAFLGNM